MHVLACASKLNSHRPHKPHKPRVHARQHPMRATPSPSNAAPHLQQLDVCIQAGQRGHPCLARQLCDASQLPRTRLGQLQRGAVGHKHNSKGWIRGSTRRSGSSKANSSLHGAWHPRQCSSGDHSIPSTHRSEARRPRDAVLPQQDRNTA